MNKMAIAMLPLVGLSMFAAPAGMAMAAEPTAEHVAERQENFFQREADILGLTLDQVKSAWSEGKRLMEIAKDHGISKEDLKTKVQAWAKAHRQERLETLVSEGVITQAQADARKAAMEKRAEEGKGKNHPLRHFIHGRR